MSLPRHIFLFLFVGLLAMSAVQFFFLESSDLKSISLVEEEQHTVTFSQEILPTEHNTSYFQMFAKISLESFVGKYTIVHIDKTYPQIYIDVPYSPPELS